MAHEDHTAPAVSQPEAEPEPTPQVDFNNIMHPPREPRSQRVIGFMPNWIKNEIVAMMAEFAGTTMFLLFAFGGTNVANAPAASAGATTVTATGADTSQLLYISLCFGFSLTVNAWVFFRISGGLFNPAVSFALALIGAITWLRAVLLTVSQILGAITAAAIVSAITPGTLAVKVSKGGGISTAQALFLEMFLTAELVFTIIMLAAEKHRATYLAPVGIGLALFIAELFGVYYTGGALNPARAFAPAVVIKEFDNYHWIYWLGPYLGGALAAGFFAVNKVLKFENVNPGQDDDGSEVASNVIKILEERGLVISANAQQQDRPDSSNGSDLRLRSRNSDSNEKYRERSNYSAGQGNRGVAPPIDGHRVAKNPGQMV